MSRAKVAVFNAHADTVEMLHVALQHAGFQTMDAPLREFERGLEGALAFLREHQPDTVVYDISPPYEWTASFCCDLQEADAQRAWVITSTNPGRTARDIRTRPEQYELIGKPYDLADVIAAVRRAVEKNHAGSRDVSS
jgi:DNA-binding response OmpR family regulator